MFYAAINTRADLKLGNRGFLNTWAIARFQTRSERDAFVDRHYDRLAKPVTRKEATDIWNGTYLSVGDKIPLGGLFHDDGYGSNFYGE